MLRVAAAALALAVYCRANSAAAQVGLNNVAGRSATEAPPSTPPAERDDSEVARMARADIASRGPLESTDDKRTEGTAVLALALDVGFLDPDGTQSNRDGSVGFSMQIVTKRTRRPAMIGLGGGLMLFGGSAERGPTAASVDADGSLVIGRTTESRSTQLRHAELIVRVEPFWGVVRPFAEGSFGLAVLWQSAKLTDSSGDDLLVQERQRDFGALFGVAAGLDIPLLSLWPKQSYASDLVLSLGCRRLYTSRMERPTHEVAADMSPRARDVRSGLAIWQPFAALAISFDTRAETKQARDQRPR